MIPLNTNRYLQPKINDLVIGVVVSRNAEFYTVDINSETYAILPSLEHQGATLRDKPNY